METLIIFVLAGVLGFIMYKRSSKTKNIIKPQKPTGGSTGSGGNTGGGSGSGGTKPWKENTPDDNQDPNFPRPKELSDDSLEKGEMK